MEKALTNKKYLLEKFAGKGGWTYAPVPGIRGDSSKAFGMIRVKSSIDDHGIGGYHLMPMKNGDLVKADVRKKIGNGEQTIRSATNQTIEIIRILRVRMDLKGKMNE